METEDHYLQQLIAGSTNMPPNFAPLEPEHRLFTGNQLSSAAAPPPHQFHTMLARHVTDLTPRAGLGGTSHTNFAASVDSNGDPSSNFSGGFECDVVAGGTGRWPRQETLTLLEIRSRLDVQFKEANQKAPLWDEVSRIMSEDYGYQRSGKKCREKLENLYKYYKKTKEGKVGRQDGKHYRFFRQLEAIYTDPLSMSETHLDSDNLLRFQNKHYDHSLGLSDHLELDTCSSDDVNLEERRKKRRVGRKGKVREFIDSEMRKVMERQEAWLEKMMRALEEKERERVVREEEWRRREAERMDREHMFWVKERAWIETRDKALMEIMDKIKGRRDLDENNSSRAHSLNNNVSNNHVHGGGSYCEIVNEKGYEMGRLQSYVGSSSNVVQDSCFRFFVGDGYHQHSLWENYDIKLDNRGNM